MLAFAMSLNMGTVQINRPIHTEHLRLHLQPHLKMGCTPIFAFVFAMLQTQTQRQMLSVNGPLQMEMDPNTPDIKGFSK